MPRSNTNVRADFAVAYRLLASRIAIILANICFSLWFSIYAFPKDIQDAARDGDLGTVKSLLQGDPRLVFSQGGTYGGTPLLWAALGGHQEIAELLLRYKADVNARDDNGMTPLHEAATYGHENIVKLLLDNGAHVNVKDESGETPLHDASRGGFVKIVELLLAKKASVNVRDHADDGGEYPLHLAANEGSEDVVKLLLAHGARVNAKDSSGVTPLADAAQWGYSNIVATLLASGADVDLEDDYGDTPLYDAATGPGETRPSHPVLYSNTPDTNDYIGTIKLLLAKGVDINARNKLGETALLRAAENTDTNVLVFLLAHGADVNPRDHLGYTPLGVVVSLHTPFDYNWETRAKILRQYGGHE